jgi:Mce-associated membrane protein
LRLSTLRWARIATVLAVLGSVALFTASGYMIQQRHNVQAGDRNRAEFVAAARQAAVTLMSIDFNNPQESVQRIVDNSTGSFRQEFEGAADDFIKMAKDAKVTTKATATAAAVESITVDSAVALVSVSSTVTNAAGADEAPRSWRLTVDLQREGDQIKMAKVEFVP